MLLPHSSNLLIWFNWVKHSSELAQLDKEINLNLFVLSVVVASVQNFVAHDILKAGHDILKARCDILKAGCDILKAGRDILKAAGRVLLLYPRSTTHKSYLLRTDG